MVSLCMCWMVISRMSWIGLDCWFMYCFDGDRRLVYVWVGWGWFMFGLDGWFMYGLDGVGTFVGWTVALGMGWMKLGCCLMYGSDEDRLLVNVKCIIFYL